LAGLDRLKVKSPEAKKDYNGFDEDTPCLVGFMRMSKVTISYKQAQLAHLRLLIEIDTFWIIFISCLVNKLLQYNTI